jgi:response regulator RpfG family c-di-GMP phosphodiesterase
MKKINVLYLDDDIDNLNSLKASLRKDYNIYTANFAEDAMNILDEVEDIHVIISDQRMPDMTGVEFFEKIDSKNPFAIKILATGYTDIQAVIDAINKGKVYRYISKPWNESELKFFIEDAYKIYEGRRRKEEEINSFLLKLSKDISDPMLALKEFISLIMDNHIDITDQKNYLNFIKSKIDEMSINIRQIVDPKKKDQ